MYICKEVAIYDYMNRDDYISNQDIIALLFQRLKEYRLAARMSQKELAERSGVGLTTICHLEQGANRNITLNNFISMALKQINKFIPKRVRRNSDGTES